MHLTLSVDEMIQRYLKSPLASSIVATRDHRNLNLHDANYISLNTPFDNASSREDAEYKNSGEKLFNYIKLFLKTKQHSKRGTKVHSLRGDSQTRRHRRHDRRAEHYSNLSVSLSTHQTKKHAIKNHKRLYSKTRRNGKFMRI